MGWPWQAASAHQTNCSITHPPQHDTERKNFWAEIRTGGSHRNYNHRPNRLSLGNYCNLLLNKQSRMMRNKKPPKPQIFSPTLPFFLNSSSFPSLLLPSIKWWMGNGDCNLLPFFFMTLVLTELFLSHLLTPVTQKFSNM